MHMAKAGAQRPTDFTDHSRTVHKPIPIVLHADIDDAVDSELRTLVNGKNIKYLSIAPGTNAKVDLTRGPGLAQLLSTAREGDWNWGRVYYDHHNDRAWFSQLDRRVFRGIRHLFHPTVHEYATFTTLQCFRPEVRKVTHPNFQQPVVIKFSPFEALIDPFERETIAYQWLSGQNFVPDFLGHVSEHGRVIGFILEYVPKASPAGPGDLKSCMKVLTRLHDLGIKHGDLNRYNFLIREDGEAVLADFATACKCERPSELEKEKWELSWFLSDDICGNRSYPSTRVEGAKTLLPAPPNPKNSCGASEDRMAPLRCEKLSVSTTA